MSSPSTATTMPSQLGAQLTDDNASDWLLVFSKCSLEQLARVCIQFIWDEQLTPTSSLITAIQPAHIDLLLSSMAQRLSGMAQRLKDNQTVISELRPRAEEAERLESKLKGAALRLSTPAVL